MIRHVTIEVSVDPKEYHRAKDSPEGAIALVAEMLRGGADIPRHATISCESKVRTLKVGR